MRLTRPSLLPAAALAAVAALTLSACGGGDSASDASASPTDAGSGLIVAPQARQRIAERRL